MEETWERESDALANNDLTTSARTLLGWMRARTEEILIDRKLIAKSFSVTIYDVVSAMDNSRNSASLHLNELEKAGYLERFVPNGGKCQHHWRIS